MAAMIWKRVKLDGPSNGKNKQPMDVYRAQVDGGSILIVDWGGGNPLAPVFVPGAWSFDEEKE
jgi:hypothetical protein